MFSVIVLVVWLYVTVLSTVMLGCPLIKIKSGADGHQSPSLPVCPGWFPGLTLSVSVWLWQDIIILFSLSSLYSYCALLLFPGHLQYLHISSHLPRPRIKTASNTIIFTTVHIFITVISQHGYIHRSIFFKDKFPGETLKAKYIYKTTLSSEFKRERKNYLKNEWSYASWS